MRKMPGAMRSRPESTAYVPYGKGKHYVCGAFNGGVRWLRGQSERKIPNNWFIRNVMIPGCKVVSVFIPSKKYRNKVKKPFRFDLKIPPIGGIFFKEHPSVHSTDEIKLILRFVIPAWIHPRKHLFARGPGRESTASQTFFAVTVGQSSECTHI